MGAWFGYSGTLRLLTATVVPWLFLSAAFSAIAKLPHPRESSLNHSSPSYSALSSAPEPASVVVTVNVLPRLEQALFIPMPNRPKPALPVSFAIVNASARALAPIPRPSSETVIRSILKSSVTLMLVLPPDRASMALSISSATACSVRYPVRPSLLTRLLSGVMSTVLPMQPIGTRGIDAFSRGQNYKV